jgi:hypothetical protein
MPEQVAEKLNVAPDFGVAQAFQACDKVGSGKGL